MLDGMSIRIPDPQPEPTVSGTMRTVQLPDEAEARRLIEVQEAGGVETFAAVELERVEGHNGLLVFTGAGPQHGTLWVQGEKHHVESLGREKVRVTFEGSPPTPRYLIPADKRNLPATLAEWDRCRGRNSVRGSVSCGRRRRTVEPCA